MLLMKLSLVGVNKISEYLPNWKPQKHSMAAILPGALINDDGITKFTFTQVYVCVKGQSPMTIIVRLNNRRPGPPFTNMV